MPLEQLWATWRSAYVTGAAEGRDRPEPLPEAAIEGGSLFERILAAGEVHGDDAVHIVRREQHCFVLLNRFPYTSGHLMVLPNRAVADLEALSPQEESEIWPTVRRAVVALKAGLRCEAVNVGVNLGRAAGGSQADHLHVHCVPRWAGDANFMGTIGGAQVLPVSLDDALRAIRAAWPPD